MIFYMSFPRSDNIYILSFIAGVFRSNLPILINFNKCLIILVITRERI